MVKMLSAVPGIVKRHRMTNPQGVHYVATFLAFAYSCQKAPRPLRMALSALGRLSINFERCRYLGKVFLYFSVEIGVRRYED